MTIAVSVLLGAVGAATGLYIPSAAERIARYKYIKKSKSLPEDPRFKALILKLLFCLISGAAWAAYGFYVTNMVEAVCLALLTTTAFLIALIDIRIRIIPNELVLTLLTVGALSRVLSGGFGFLLSSIISLLLMMAVFTAVAGIMGFGKVGAGDVKLAGAMGLALGYPDIIVALAVMCGVLLITVFVGLIMKKLTLKSMLPFAPFMMAGLAAALMVGIFR